ncbi:MAG: glycosyltransferase [Candidatus Hydrogenedentes bacterium]|nr:glycosyltransferase [Candidatus Hydrogenedentota bacterium]
MTQRDDTAARTLVSVVMATYRNDNVAHLGEAIASVRAQTYRALELIIVIDGPIEPQTRILLDTTALDDARVRLLPLPENVGPALARNAGIAEAKGTYIAILDADDRALPERIARQVALLEETGADLVGSQYRLIDETGAIVGKKSVPVTPEAIRKVLYLFNPIANSTVLAKAEVLKRHPYRDVDALGPRCFGEDYDLWVTLALEGFVLRNAPEVLVEFRTDSRFLGRRRGLRVFRADLRTKLRTLPLYPAHRRPWVALVSFGVAVSRLAPAWALTVLYRLRNRARF